MRALAGELLLKAWEEGLDEPELRRPLALLAVAMPDTDRGQLETMPVSERNRLLLGLHELSFGATLTAVTSCSACKEPLEFSVPVAQLTQILADAGEDALEWQEIGHEYRLRAVTTADLLATLATDELDQAQDLLLSRCLTVTPPHNGEGEELKRATLTAKFEQLHAATELSCAITCPGCSETQQVDVDIARFLWSEVRSEGQRLLGDVHVLATHYGWSEQAILALQDRRRAAYLEMVEA